MKNFLFTASQSSSVDKASNQLSLFNLLELINVTIPDDQEKPVKIPIAFDLTSCWIKDGDEGNLVVKYQLVDMNEKVLIESPEREMEVKDDSIRIKHRERFNYFPVTETGIYHLKLLQKKGKDFYLITEVPVEVIVKTKKRA